LTFLSGWFACEEHCLRRAATASTRRAVFGLHRAMETAP